jgi:hypothetical protein
MITSIGFTPYVDCGSPPLRSAAAAILSENSRKAPEHGTIALSGVNGPPLAKLFVTPGNLLR